MKSCLVPDLTATKDIDPVLAQMDHEIGKWERVAESEDTDTERVAELLSELRESRQEYVDADDTKPVVTIGYMPPAKRTGIRNEGLKLIGLGDDGEALCKSAEHGAALDREVVSWGLRGWTLQSESGPIEFDTELAKVGGVEYPQAKPEMVAIVEAMGWLPGVAAAVLEFNTLDAKTKKK